MAEPTFDLNKRWSEAYPEPVPTEPCISPAYFALERERVFRTVWLYVGREKMWRGPAITRCAVWMSAACPCCWSAGRTASCAASSPSVRTAARRDAGTSQRLPPRRDAADAQRLFFLTLSFAEIAPFVECYRGEPRVPDSFDESRFHALHADRSPFAYKEP